MHTPWTRLVTTAVAVVCLAACGDRPADRSPGEPDVAELDRLRALPYVDFSTHPVDESKRGVVLWDE